VQNEETTALVSKGLLGFDWVGIIGLPCCAKALVAAERMTAARLQASVFDIGFRLMA
jgi:hypothetical protein